MKKDKDPKAAKREAFMSFLEGPTGSSEIMADDGKKPSSDHQECYEQYVQDTNTCRVCGVATQQKKKRKCGFCNFEVCSNHLRKRRKLKSKWTRICDDCEDRYLFDSYMKLQTKAQQALSVEQEITSLKHQNFQTEATSRRERRRQIAFKTITIQQKHRNDLMGSIAGQEKLEGQIKSLQTQQLTNSQLQVYIQRASTACAENFEEDFKIMSEENARLGRELTKAEKKCMEVAMAIDKREKEIEQAYENWQRKQFASRVAREQIHKGSPKKESCDIY